MTIITDAAREHLHGMLLDAGVSADAAFRILIDDEDLVLVKDRRRPQDTVTQHRDRPVLLMDDEICDLLERSTIDVRHTSVGLALAIVD